MAPESDPSSSPSVSESEYRIDNPMPHLLPEGENATPLEVTGTTASEKLVIIMVGLPANGTYDARMLVFQFFFWLSVVIPFLCFFVSMLFVIPLLPYR